MFTYKTVLKKVLGLECFEVVVMKDNQVIGASRFMTVGLCNQFVLTLTLKHSV